MTDLIRSPAGIRGQVGGSLTPAIALEVGCVFGQFVAKQSVVIGRDTRPSGAIYQAAVTAGLLSQGCTVIDCGCLPTPTLQQAIRHHQAGGGVMITASHNPAEWNGLKLMNASGSFLDNTEYHAYKAVDDQISNISNTSTVPWDKVGNVQSDTQAINRHVDRILACIAMPDVSHLSVFVDANHGTGCLATPVLLDRLNVNYTMMQSEGDGLFSHLPEPIISNVGSAITRMQSGGYDIGFIQDPDADRLVILDETGRYIGEDYTLGLCTDYVLSESEPGQHIALNLSTSVLLDTIARRYQAHSHRTKIGETYVTQALKATGGIIGGEGNGGVIYTPVGWGRDSLVGMALLLKALAKKQTTVSAWVDSLPRYTSKKEAITRSKPVDWSTLLQRLGHRLPDYTQDTSDGIKLVGDDDWVHIRPSNTEPLIRLFSEAKTDARCALLNKIVKDCISLDA